MAIRFVEGMRVVYTPDGVLGTVAKSEPYPLSGKWHQTVMTGAGTGVWVNWDDGESGFAYIQDVETR
jgi:hypothetical protein